MNQYWPDVRSLLEILSYMIKDADSEGVEIRFSNSNHHVKSRHTTKLLKSFDRLDPKGSEDISASLQRILSRYVLNLGELTRSPSILTNHKTLRPLNLYIFSNGKWSSDSDVQVFIKNFSHKLAQIDPRKSSHVGIQFIKFGADPSGQTQFSRLDDGSYFKSSVTPS